MEGLQKSAISKSQKKTLPHFGFYQSSFFQVCLTSNVGNGFKVANYGLHPVKLLQVKN